MTKNILITGGNGFIGGRLVGRLLESGQYKTITIIDTQFSLKNRKEIENIISKPNIRFFDTDIYLNLRKLEEIVSKQDVIFHLGAIASTSSQISKYDINLFNYEIVTKFFEFIGKYNVLLIAASSYAVYGNVLKENPEPNPINTYGLSKLMMEKRLYETTSNSVILRFTNVYGLGEHHKGAMVSLPLAMHREAIAKASISCYFVENSNSRIFAQRDFIFVDDLIDVMVSLANHSKFHEYMVHDLGAGIPISTHQVAKMVLDNLELTADKIEQIPAPNVDAYQLFSRADMSLFNQFPEIKRPRSPLTGIIEYLKFL